jgi:hypothetical protein
MGNAVDFLGYFGALCVLSAFSVRRLSVLRSISILGNVVFMAYAFAAEVHPVLLMNGALLVLNLYRLCQQWGEARPKAKSAGARWHRTVPVASEKWQRTRAMPHRPGARQTQISLEQRAAANQRPPRLREVGPA